MIRLTTFIHICLSPHSLNNKKNVVPGGRSVKSLGGTRPLLLLCLAIVLAHASDYKAQNLSTLDRLQRAAGLIREGQLGDAETELKLVFRRAPREANALNLLGVVRAQQHRATEAEQLFLRAIEVNKLLLGAYLNIGQLYLDQEKPDRALWAFTEAGKLQPESPNINFNLASLYERKKEYERALEYLSKIPVAQVDSDGLFLLIKSHLALNHTQEAKALSASLRESSKIPPDVAAAVAAVFAQHGLVDEAIEILEAARRVNGPSFALLFNLGATLYQKGERERAEESYLAALSVKPNDVPTLRALANIARAGGELEKALSYLVRARKLAPDSLQVLYDFSWITLNLDLSFDALSGLERLHRMKPDEPSYLYALAIARLHAGEPMRAQALADRYIELRPEDARGYYVLGVTLYSLKQLHQARAALERSIKLTPIADAEYYLSMIAENEGDLAQATSWLQRALVSEPKHAEAHAELGIIYAKQKDYAAARAELERAVKLDPEDLKAHHQLGMVYTRLGEKILANNEFAVAEKLRVEERKREVVGLRLVDPPK